MSTLDIDKYLVHFECLSSGEEMAGIVNLTCKWHVLRCFSCFVFKRKYGSIRLLKNITGKRRSAFGTKISDVYDSVCLCLGATLCVALESTMFLMYFTKSSHVK